MKDRYYWPHSYDPDLFVNTSPHPEERYRGHGSVDWEVIMPDLPQVSSEDLDREPTILTQTIKAGRVRERQVMVLEDENIVTLLAIYTAFTNTVFNHQTGNVSVLPGIPPIAAERGIISFAIDVANRTKYAHREPNDAEDLDVTNSLTGPDPLRKIPRSEDEIKF